ncbi:MAG TPA: NlpC/P60 family protein [Micromonospora sp.]|nr:NlpC/P60 family protein [Micromonospora sp.]
MTLRAGREAVVRVAVATLWGSPEKVRSVDTPALAVQPDIPAWISGMNSDQQVGDCVLSQLLLGERVLVTELRPDGWAHIVALEQSAPKLDPRGYPGWVPAAQLTPAPDPEPEAALVVDATGTHLRARPDGAVVLPHVILGTRLTPAGLVEDGWRPVRVPGRDRPLWLPDTHLVPIPAGPPTADEVLATAKRLTEVTYIWGGVSTYGLDCSGLVHLVWRRLGVRLPRDAHDQAAATTAVTLGEERPGDLYFFARPDRRIHHIGIVTTPPGAGTGRRMLDACYVRRKVNDLPLSADRVETLVAAHRVS